MTDQALHNRPTIASHASSSGTATTVTAPRLLVIFVIVLILPVSINLAGFRISPSRMFLLIMFIPLLLNLLSGKVGKVHLIDITMMLLAFWIVITLVYHEGLERLAYSVMSAAELLGGYLLGRTMIRNANDFRYLIKCQLGIMLFLLPFAAIDFATNNEIWAKFLSSFGDASFRQRSSEPRWGFQRVLTGFDHPILYGVFCSMAAANVLYIWRDKLAKSFGLLGFVTIMTFMSLSAGALLSVLFQCGMVAWDVVTRSKWRLLFVLAVMAYIFLTFASNRGPIILMIELMTFSSNTGWTRVLQWEYVGAEVMRHPFLGKGLDLDWIRPAWLHTSSIDSYWLVMAYRHGLPAITLVAISIIGGFVFIARAKDLAPDAANIRKGYLMAFLGVCFSLGTVHIWNATAIYIYYYLGAGLWLATQSAQTSDNIAPPEPQRSSRYGRKTVPDTDPISAPSAPDVNTKTAYSRFPVRSRK